MIIANIISFFICYNKIFISHIIVIIMSTIISTVTTDVFLRTIVNITTSIISTNPLYKWFLEHKNNDYLIYQK